MLPAEGVSRLLVLLVFAGAVSLGLPDALLGLAWPSLRDAFGRSQKSLGLLLVASGTGYFLASALGGRLVARLGIGLLLALSTALVAAGCLGTALAPAWGVALAAAAAVGLGSGAVDAGLNTYAALRLSARHMTWMHACYSAGALTGPVVMTAVLAGGRSWRIGYLVIAAAVAALAAVFFAALRRWGTAAPPAAGAAPPARPTRRAGMQVAIFFLYTGLEVAVGAWAFTLLTESRGFGRAAVGAAVAGYWAAFLLGRIAAGAIADRLDLDRLVRGCLWTVLAGAGLLAFRGPATSVAALVALGLALAPVFPALMARTPHRLGAALAAHAVGWQVSASMIGAAALPSLAGLAAGAWGLEAVAAVGLAAAAVLAVLHEALLKG